MARAPFQVFVIPFRRSGNSWEFAALRRSDEDYWQFIAGGGNEGESPREAAVREAEEEAGIPRSAAFYRLQSLVTVPRAYFQDRLHWPPDLYVIPEYAFAVECAQVELRLSHEHTELVWKQYETIRDLLRWDSNRVALWELQSRLAAAELSPGGHRFSVETG